MVLLGSCRDEPVTPLFPGPEICFSLSGTPGQPITRTGGEREGTDMVVVDSLLGVLPLQTEDGGRELYLHAFLSGSDRAGEGRVLTRAAPVDGAGFYDAFGVLASVYSGAWDESSCFPDYMYNVGVTKASSWTTSYHWPGGGRNVRFFALQLGGDRPGWERRGGNPGNHLFGPGRCPGSKRPADGRFR